MSGVQEDLMSTSSSTYAETQNRKKRGNDMSVAGVHA